MKFLSLICRCRDEFFIQEFCDYYLSQGVDDIYIIDDDSENKSIYDFIYSNKHSNIHLINSERQYSKAKTETNFLNKEDQSNKLFNKIKKQYVWMIYVDVDEFIATKKNFNLTIRDQLKIIYHKFPKKRLILSPWVMMSGMEHKTNPESILNSINYRWNHDVKHPYPVKKFDCRYYKTFCKSIFQPLYFDWIRDHIPIQKVKSEYYYNGIDLSTERLEEDKFLNLRNRDIKSGYFLCYHFRYISEEHALSKLKTNGWYVNDGYNLQDLQASYPEVYDDTFLRK